MNTVLKNVDLETSYAEAEDNFKQRNPNSAAMHVSASEAVSYTHLTLPTTPYV